MLDVLYLQSPEQDPLAGHERCLPISHKMDRHDITKPNGKQEYCYSEAEPVKLTWQTRFANKFRIKNQLMRKTIAEFFATFFLMIFVESTVASAVLSGRQFDLLLGSFGQGLAVIMALYVAGGVSGSFLNPAVNVAFAFLGKLPWSNCLCYSVAQYLGAFGASIVVYGIHYESLNKYDGGVRITAGPNGTASIFTTFPGDHRSTGGAFFHEVMCTSFLLIGVLAISDERNWKPEKGLFPFAIGFLIMLINLAFSYGESLAMNPARDFAPRLFALMAGWGSDVISVWDYGFFWIPIVGSHAGAIVGALAYSLLIEIHHPPDETKF